MAHSNPEGAYRSGGAALASTSAVVACGGNCTQCERSDGGFSPDGASCAVPKSRTRATRLVPVFAGVEAQIA